MARKKPDERIEFLEWVLPGPFEVVVGHASGKGQSMKRISRVHQLCDCEARCAFGGDQPVNFGGFGWRGVVF